MPLITGEITFEDGSPPFTGATMYVRLEDTTEADIDSVMVAEYVERDVAFDPAIERAYAFVLDGKTPNPRASYSVRAHIDADGDGEVSLGDFISTQSYPVITFGHPNDVSILVRQVT